VSIPPRRYLRLRTSDGSTTLGRSRNRSSTGSAARSTSPMAALCAVFSQRDHHLLRHPGRAWLRDVPWPMRQAVLDGEVGAETGMESIQAVVEARGPADPAAAFIAFDLI